MDSDAVGINCTQRWDTADTLVTIKGEGEGEGMGHDGFKSRARRGLLQLEAGSGTANNKWRHASVRNPWKW
jgi:hypothetical protein